MPLKLTRRQGDVIYLDTSDGRITITVEDIRDRRIEHADGTVQHDMQALISVTAPAKVHIVRGEIA